MTNPSFCPPEYPEPADERDDHGTIWWTPDFENNTDKGHDSYEEAIAYYWEHRNRIRQSVIAEVELQSLLTRKQMWLASFSTESGDCYYNVGQWDHEPSQDELRRFMVENFPGDIEEASSEEEANEAPSSWQLNGKWYKAYVAVANVSCIELK